MATETRSITIIRHGHREDFVGDEWSPLWSETAETPHDPDISPRGILEAKALGARWADRAPMTILSSPFLRTVHTSSLIAAPSGSNVKIEPGLHEWLHPDGFPEQPELRSLAQLQSRFQNVDLYHHPVTAITYPERTMGAVVTRVDTALQAILAAHEGDLVLVTHADPLLAMLMASGIEACRQPIRTCSIYTITGRPGQWQLTENGTVFTS